MNQYTALTLPFSPHETETIRSIYRLGALGRAQPVLGGLSHRLCRLENEEGGFALKILSPRAVATETERQNLEQAETVAQIARQNSIPALVALAGTNGKYLQNIGEQWVLLYPWQEGEVLPPTAVSAGVATQMGALLGQLHALQIRFVGQKSPEPEAFDVGHWAALAQRGRSENAVWGDALNDDLPRLNEANHRAMEAQLALRAGWVTGHLDLDQKNVLWHKGQPTILDFESAKPIHPALELLGSGLSWAGQSAGDAEQAVFTTFVRSYRSHNPVSFQDLEVACDAVLGKWLIWLEFNLRRSLESGIRGTAEERICLDSLWHALRTTLQLLEDVPLYRGWCRAAEGDLPMERSKSAS